MKTLSLRVERQNATAQLVANRLIRHPQVERVYYPGLVSHPTHRIARSQMRGFGGIVSFVVKGGLAAASRVVDAVRLAHIGTSFGGVETFVEQPTVVSYYKMTAEERAKAGIVDGLVRLSVGVENEKDVLADIEQALGHASGH